MYFSSFTTALLLSHTASLTSYYLHSWLWRELPSVHEGPNNCWHLNNNPCGLHHWPEWQYRPRTWLKEEIRSRDDHGRETAWPQIARVTSNNRNVRKPTWPKKFPVTRCTTFQRVRNVRCRVFQNITQYHSLEVSIRALAWKHLATGLT